MSDSVITMQAIMIAIAMARAGGFMTDGWGRCCVYNPYTK